MRKLLIIALFISGVVLPIAGQEIIYLSPAPGSTFNPSASTVIIKCSNQIIESSLYENIIFVIGSESGKHTGKILLADDKQTIIFKPDEHFLPGEMVEVFINEGIKTIDGMSVPPYNFEFSIEPKINEQIYTLFRTSLEPQVRNKLSSENHFTEVPKIRTSILNESAIGEGKIFLSAYGVINQTFQSNPAINSSLLIANNDGSIFYSKDIGSNKGAGLTDFKMHPNGLMSYPKVLKNYQWTGGAEVIHMVMDKSFAVVDSFQMGNGYTAETHDFQLLPNGHALLMAYYLVPIDIRSIVPGSHPNAFIDGAVIQELDADKNVVFQWRTWDYISPSVIPWNMVPGNTQQIINVFHLNSVSQDNDGNLLLGTPGMGLKVSRQTGKILWIIGGILNQFTFSNVAHQEAVGDFGGHTLHRLENGNILVFDNSPFPWQPGYGQISSEVAEYSIDEINKKAELVWKYKPEQIIPGWHAGSAQRLSNGNTVICWGGPPNEGNVQIPIMTEVTQNGEKVFELFFEGTELESYRAFRFELDEGEPSIEVTRDQLLALNTYEFKKDDFNNTGIAIKINEMESFGYNLITVKNYSFAPLAPQFEGKAPLVIPRKIFISSFGISSIKADLRIDINNWGIVNPESAIIYYRKNQNNGMFVPLATTYNFVTGKLTAVISSFGEYIVASPDLSSLLLAPIPNSPANQSSVNFKLPVILTWSPVGFALNYSLQVSMNEDFTNLIVDEKSLPNAKYNLGLLSSNTKYYWRVKTLNDAGESDWCNTQTFETVLPFIKIKRPNGGERWHIGLEYFLEWEDNINEAVTVTLIKNDTPIKNINSTTNTFYPWEIDLTAPPANDYKIKIASITDSTLYDISDNSFSIIDTVTSISNDDRLPDEFTLSQNYPNPFNSETIISFSLTEDRFTSLKIFNSLGEEIANLVNEELRRGKYFIKWNATNQTSGIYYYKLISGLNSITKKLILLK